LLNQSISMFELIGSLACRPPNNS